MGEADMLRGFAMSTLDKLPQERPDIARTDENWENWDMEASINNFQQWLKRHKVDNVNGNSGGVRPKREKPWFNEERKDPVCIFCKVKHWTDACEVVKTMEARRHFSRKRNCVLTVTVQDPGQSSVATGSFNKCQSKQHTGVCNRLRGNETETWQKSNAVLNGYIPSFEEKSLPAIVPLKLKRITFWAHLDTGSGRNFISKLLTD